MACEQRNMQIVRKRNEPCFLEEVSDNRSTIYAEQIQQTQLYDLLITAQDLRNISPVLTSVFGRCNTYIYLEKCCLYYHL